MSRPVLTQDHLLATKQPQTAGLEMNDIGILVDFHHTAREVNDLVI